MAGNRHNTEVPYQNYDKLKQTILMKRQRGKPELFTDPSFPPDLSSLTYVYIGDDRYERTKFARPLVGIICQMHVQCTCMMTFSFIYPPITFLFFKLSQNSHSGYLSIQLNLKSKNIAYVVFLQKIWQFIFPNIIISFTPIILTYITLCIFLISMLQTIKFESYILAFISYTNVIINLNAALFRQILVTFHL